MSTFIDRLISERHELRDKLYKLSTFLDSHLFKSLPDVQRELLTRQYKVMVEYEEILKERIYSLGVKSAKRTTRTDQDESEIDNDSDKTVLHTDSRVDIVLLCMGCDG